ncbi:hypothetical protein I6N95_15505 [Vagococcus sp. BWB3-3]|uniref:Uncharacterized protein n=1 Tax=Vagococcus allomyrinae TaxID=2794353 RepID=A0A940P7C6_9ENTE|nr:hypothetical protein [Vagococcus allomyrinae]MBP1042425.1 hypothetical protein [Vagococcus allomyrinae]
MIHNNYLTLKNRAIQVYKLIQDHQKKKYPIPYLNDLFQELEIIYNGFIDKYLSKEEVSDITILDLVKINKFVNGTNSLILGTLHNASVIKNPKSITIPIKEMLEMTQSSSVYIPELIWDVNYYIGEVTSVYNRLVKSIGLDVTLNIPLYRFGIPHFYQDDALMSGILGHELGHYFDLFGNLDISEKLLITFVNDSSLIDELKPYIVFEEGASLVEVDKNEIVQLFLSDMYLNNWLNEFVADTIGIALYGPASFFSSERLIQSITIEPVAGKVKADSSSDTHPRNKLRYQVKKRVLEILDYDLPQIFQDEIDRCEQIWENAIKLYPSGNTIVGKMHNKIVGLSVNQESLGIIETYLMKKIDTIINFCLAEMPRELIYQPQQMTESIEVLAEKLGQLLPPNELAPNSPSDSISIINAGWLAYLVPSKLLKRQYRTNTELIQAINSMLTRGLEVAAIHRRWKNVNIE